MSRRRGARPCAPWDGDRGSSHRCGRRGPALVPSSGEKARGCGRRAGGGGGGGRRTPGVQRGSPGRTKALGEGRPKCRGRVGGTPEKPWKRSTGDSRVGGRVMESNQSRPRQSPNNAGSPPLRTPGSALEPASKHRAPHLFRGGPPQQTASLSRPVSPPKGRHGFHGASRTLPARFLPQPIPCPESSLRPAGRGP